VQGGARFLRAAGKTVGKLYAWERFNVTPRESAARGREVYRMYHRRIMMRIAQVAPLFESVPPRLYGARNVSSHT